MVQNNQEYRCMYWVTRSSICSSAHTAHSFACPPLLALLASSAALIHLLARSLSHSHACGQGNDYILGHQAVLNYSVGERKRDQGLKFER